MKILVFAAILGLSTNFALAECTDYMQAFNKHQLVIKGMMDLNFQGKMNSELGDTIGKRLQEAQKPLDAGEYNKACEMYDSILNDYGFDKSFGEAPASDKAKSTEQTSSEISEDASTAPASASSSADEASSPAESKPEDN